MKAPKEQDIQKACIEYLWLIGAVPLRINSGGMMGEYKGKKRYVRFVSEPGCSDIVCCLPDGVFGAIEVKRPGSHTDKERMAKQLSFLDRVRKAGGLGVMVSSVVELQAALKLEGYEV